MGEGAVQGNLGDSMWVCHHYEAISWKHMCSSLYSHNHIVDRRWSMLGYLSSNLRSFTNKPCDLRQDAQLFCVAVSSCINWRGFDLTENWKYLENKERQSCCAWGDWAWGSITGLSLPSQPRSGSETPGASWNPVWKSPFTAGILHSFCLKEIMLTRVETDKSLFDFFHVSFCWYYML